MLNCYLLTRNNLLMSLTYEIKSKNVYEEFYKWKDLFDFSNYSKKKSFLMRLIKKLLVK